MENSLPLNDYRARKTNIIINRLHAFIHGAAILALFSYRITSIYVISKSSSSSSILPHLLIFIAELILSFLWLLSQAAKWNPLVRTAYPQNLPSGENLPSLDVYVCTADAEKEPSLGVMNTVISAMALDYPPHKLHVYLSDDGGSPVTLHSMREAWSFAKVWIPFCRKFEVKTRCPEAYFSRERSGGAEFDDDDFLAEERFVENAYEEFKICLAKIAAGTDSRASKNHPSIIEIMNGAKENKPDPEIPLLVYLAREKRPSHSHHFKAGALNVLLRVSALISNSPYILVLDCDMYCNDPMSARQAMCFHLDPKLSPKLGFVQYPQKFHNLCEKDIYDGELRYAWEMYEGLDGLRGPILSGTGFYMKRDALYGTQELRKQNVDPIHMNKCFGTSKELIKSINYKHEKLNHPHDDVLEKELQLVASCSYDDDTEWGEKVGFRYYTVVEDVFTGLILHCEGWNSIYYGPSRACFLGTSPVSLAEVLVQHMRWGLGLYQIALSKFSPLVYGSRRMSILQSMCYTDVTFYPLYFLPLYILALLPPFSLLRGIHLYPQISSPFFVLFVFVFLSWQAKHVQEILVMGYPIRVCFTEQRVWMFKSLTSYLFANLNTAMDKMGLVKASFLPTNKVANQGADKLYQMGKYNFEAPNMFMVPLCTLYIFNLASFLVGFAKILHAGKGSEMLMIEALIPLFGVTLHLPLLEGMVLRKDIGRVPINVSLISMVVSSILLAYASFTSN